jgi:serine/threonine protein kinase
MDRLVGRTLGAYELQGLLGQGGMGAVFRAVHRGLKQPRALKVLPPHLAWDKSFVERFQQEATTAASLRHPNIVLIYRIGENESRLFRTHPPSRAGPGRFAKGPDYSPDVIAHPKRSITRKGGKSARGTKQAQM